MDRRTFLVSAGIMAAFTSIPFIRRLSPPKPTIINDAYSLWYNRPAIAEVSGGFCFGYVTTAGEVRVAEINDQLLVGRVSRIHKYEGSSDHGSPSLLKVPSGQYAGHILACFSKHVTPLLCARTTRPGDIGAWEQSRVIDTGRSTYVSLAALPDGKIVLMHTLQEETGQELSSKWRRVVARITEDGGDTWSEPILIADLGATTFPYSTPLTVSAEGRCAMTYAVYSSTKNRHQGLTVVVTEDAFKTKIEISIDLGKAALLDTIPYETKWVSASVVAVSYSEASDSYKEGFSRMLLVDVNKRLVISNLPISQVAVHTYAGGAAVGDGGRSVVYSPVGGGLAQKSIETGEVTTLMDSGQFSSPWQFTVNGKSMITALKKPVIKTTKVFSADIFIMPVL